LKAAVAVFSATPYRIVTCLYRAEIAGFWAALTGFCWYQICTEGRNPFNFAKGDLMDIYKKCLSQWSLGKHEETNRGQRIALRLALLTVCLFCFSHPSLAQNLQAGIDFTTVFPVGEFRDNVDNNGYGVGGQFLSRLSKSPVFIGADLGIAVYGTQSRRELLSPSIPELRLKVTTRNNIGWAHFLMRLQSRKGRVQPYADGLVGVKALFTNTTITDDFSDDAIASDTNFSDATLSAGVGAGVQIELAKTGKRSDIALDTRVRYMFGGEADYLKKGSIIRTPDGVFFDVLSSRTDTVTLQIGVTFRF
jgi:opacity protein-like surface antigen